MLRFFDFSLFFCFVRVKQVILYMLFLFVFVFDYVYLQDLIVGFVFRVLIIKNVYVSILFFEG